MAIRVITFDLDNTLWDVEPALERAEAAQRDWLLRHRPGTIEHHDHSSLWEFKKGVWKRHPELAHHVSELRIRTLFELQLEAGYSEDEATSGATEAFAIFLAQRHAVELYEEALEILEQLAGRYRLGALTNGNADIFKTDAAEYFDFAFLAENIGASKPAPDMFQAALNLTDASPREIVHVGDNPEHDIAGARDIGMHTVWMNPTRAPWAEGPPPNREIDNLRQLPAAVSSIEAGLEEARGKA